MFSDKNNFPEDKLDEEKLNAIRNYLISEFPGYTVNDRYNSDRVVQTFRLAFKDKTHLVDVLRTFIDDSSVSEISNVLERSHLSKYSRREDISRIIVTNSGIKLEKK